MPLLNFQKRFVTQVESGGKKQTIRKMRKIPIKAGDKLFLYTGLRTKYCRKLGEGICERVRHILIEMKTDGISPHYTVTVNGDKECLYGEILRNIAIQDGFLNTVELISFFKKTHTLPFDGQIINW